jgi:FtsH-binding integral membrane protein
VLEPRVVGNIKERDSRMGLIRKVYAILGVQLIVTAAVAYMFMKNRDLVRYLMSDQGAWALGLAFVTALGSAIALGFPNVCRTKPWNLLLLALFTGAPS